MPPLAAVGQQVTDFLNWPCQAFVYTNGANWAILVAGPHAQCLLLAVQVERGGLGIDVAAGDGIQSADLRLVTRGKEGRGGHARFQK